MNGESGNPIAEKQGLFSGRLNFKNDDITTVLAVGGAVVAVVGGVSRVLDEKLRDNNKELTREFEKLRDNNKELTREITAATASSAQTTLLKCSVVALSGVILAPFLVLVYQKGHPPPDASRR
jgi:outer membrane murein-binding lipoprotein Lpp